jgi:hypothetical protein
MGLNEKSKKEPAERFAVQVSDTTMLIKVLLLAK